MGDGFVISSNDCFVDRPKWTPLRRLSGLRWHRVSTVLVAGVMCSLSDVMIIGIISNKCTSHSIERHTTFSPAPGVANPVQAGAFACCARQLWLKDNRACKCRLQMALMCTFRFAVPTLTTSDQSQLSLKDKVHL